MTRTALPYDYTCFADEVLHLETYAFLNCLYSEQVIVYIKQRELQAEYRQTKTIFGRKNISNINVFFISLKISFIYYGKVKNYIQKMKRRPLKNLFFK